MKKLSRLAALFGPLVIVAVLLACSAPTEIAPSPGATPKPSPTPGPAPKAPALQPKTGGTLRFWTASDPGGWDPQRRIIRSSYFAAPVFSNLVRFDLTKSELLPQNIVGDLAERWETSKDGKTWTFYLEKGVKWHDGRAFTADDVMYNLRKMMDPKRSAQSSSFPSYVDSKKVDDYTVQVQLSRPTPSFLPGLASGYSVIVPGHTGDDFKATSFLVGTGPYRFKQYTAGVSFELVKNPGYFRKGLPYPDGMTMFIIGDRSAQADAFVTKRVDMTNPSMGITSQEALDRYQTQAQGATIDWHTGPGLLYWLNTARKPLDDVRIRRALALVSNMEMVAVGGFGNARFRDLSKALFPPPYGLPKADIDKALGWDRPYDDRVAEAKKLMADAGYASGFKLKMAFSNIPEMARASEALASMYRQRLGIQVEPASVTLPELAKLQTARDYDVLLVSLASMANDPDEVTGDFKMGSPTNWTNYRNPELEKLIDQQSVEMDLSARIKICRQIEQILLNQAVVIPQGFGAFATAWWPYVKDLVVQDTYYGSYLQLERVWLDK